MEGRPVFKWAIRLVNETTMELLDHAGMTIDDVDVFVAHQANIRILDAAADHLGIDRNKLFINLDAYGNTSAASIPLALDEACRKGRVKRGDSIVLNGFGAGLVWSAGIMRW